MPTPSVVKPTKITIDTLRPEINVNNITIILITQTHKETLSCETDITIFFQNGACRNKKYQERY